METNTIPSSDTDSYACSLNRRTYTASEAVREALYFAGRAQDVYEVAVNGRLSPALREEIMVAVSRANACAICNYTHHYFSLAAGVSKSLLNRLENKSLRDVNEKTRAAVEYAVAYSLAEFGPVDKKLKERLEAHYTHQQCEDIRLVTRFITLPNLTVNKTYDLEARLAGNPTPGSSLFDELFLSSFVYTIAPVMGTLVAYYRKESPLIVLKEYLNFSKDYKRQTALEQSA